MKIRRQKQMSEKNKNIIISGGGTGGHLFPALSIADALMKRNASYRILFVGAEGRIEMERVPAAGYKIIGLPVSGIQRKLTLKNLSFFINLWNSLRKARKVVKDFKPDIAVGVGGYASFPVLWTAFRRGVPIVLQEQNSYAGLANKLLGKKAKKICVAYEHMERYFPAENIVLTGNPVRSNIQNIKEKREEACQYFGLDPKRKTLLVIGGSLGAATLNGSVINSLQTLKEAGCNVIWQTGKLYHHKIMQERELTKYPEIKPMPFIERMDLAFSIADIIVSRAGAGTISELCMVGKAVVLVPSPNVAEDHQMKNAMALVEKNAALIVKDQDAESVLIDEVIALMQDEKKMKDMGEQIKKMEKPHAANTIVDEIEKIMHQK